MKKTSKTCLTVSLGVALLFNISTAFSNEVNVYSSRQPFLIKPMFDAFTRETGIKVNTVFAKTGLIEDFIVKDDYRDMGVGTYLFEYLKNYALKHKIKRMQLVCDNHNISEKSFIQKDPLKKVIYPLGITI